MSTPQTRADYGLIVHESLTRLYDSAVEKAPLSERMAIKAIYDEAVAANVEASGVRVNRAGSVDSDINDHDAALVSFALRKARRFITAHFKTTAFELKLQKAGSLANNIVDMRTYEFIAEVLANGKTYFFCIHQDGKYILSESYYWERPRAE